MRHLGKRATQDLRPSLVYCILNSCKVEKAVQGAEIYYRR